MKVLLVLIAATIFCSINFGQPALQPIVNAERNFNQATAEEGSKAAFLAFLADDAVVFQPDAVNGHDHYLKASDESASNSLIRNLTFADIASNGLLGYTTGNWRRYQKGKSESEAKFGQYVTVWERKPHGSFRIAIDIGITHEKLTFKDTDRVQRTNRRRDLNKRGWSPADASMNFLRMSMGHAALGGAYERFAGKDVRLLVDGMPPILGKKNVVREMKHYSSVLFPPRVVSYQTADMAYLWNPCEFDSSNEGLQKGNCLHIWKLRNKKWWIVLGIFARVPNTKKPELKVGSRARSKN